jgi:hypothetical protein
MMDAKELVAKLRNPEKHDRNQSKRFELVSCELLEQAADLIEQQAATLAKLEKTADGVPVVPGVRLHPMYPLDAEYDVEDGDDYATAELCYRENLSGDVLHDELDPSKCYSTRAAAEAAAEKARK